MAAAKLVCLHHSRPIQPIGITLPFPRSLGEDLGFLFPLADLSVTFFIVLEN